MPESTNETPAYTQTLNDLLSSAAAEWSKDTRMAMVVALRTQRERWNVEQSTGSRKRVPSTKVETSVKKPGKKALSFAGLKL